MVIPDSEPAPVSAAKPRVKALLLGYYGMGNLGDEMMLFCLKSWLNDQGFDLTVLSERPEAVSKHHNLPAVENSPMLGQWAWRSSWFKGGAWRVLRALARNDALIVGGGDLIRDDLGWRTFFYTTEKLILALMMGKKVYVVNAGIGQPSTGYGRVILRWVLARCRRIIVRDLQSEQICEQLGVGSVAVLAPDIVLSLPDLLLKRSGSIVEPLADQPYVAVCLRRNPEVFGRYGMSEARIRTLARALDDLVERRGVDVVFIPFQENPASKQGDNQLHETVAQAMVHRDRAHLRPWTADLVDVCHWIRGSRLVLSMRLHAAVLAHACHRPSVLMPYDRKITEFGRLMNIPHAIEAADLDDVSQVSSVLESAWREASQKEDLSRSSAASVWEELRLEPA
jgi:polysaccharide pyruvyl transferase CsaB